MCNNFNCDTCEKSLINGGSCGWCDKDPSDCYDYKCLGDCANTSSIYGEGRDEYYEEINFTDEEKEYKECMF